VNDEFAQDEPWGTPLEWVAAAGDIPDMPCVANDPIEDMDNACSFFADVYRPSDLGGCVVHE
jgi:hypothetical protein